MIRQAGLSDLDEVVNIERTCFNEAEAASKERLKARLEGYTESFFVYELDGKLIGMVNGAVCDNAYIEDRYYASLEEHDNNAKYQQVYGLDVLPEYQRHGYGTELLNHMIDSARQRGKLGVSLTCKEEKLHFYQSFGFQCLGVSNSTHGNAVWYDMFLKLNNELEGR